MEDDKTGHADPRSQPAIPVSRWFSLFDSEKAEALAGNLESQFQPVLVLPMQVNNRQ